MPRFARSSDRRLTARGASPTRLARSVLGFFSRNGSEASDHHLRRVSRSRRSLELRTLSSSWGYGRQPASTRLRAARRTAREPYVSCLPLEVIMSRQSKLDIIDAKPEDTANRRDFLD